MTKPSNPKRTGGPRTTEGKVAASSNSLKSGAYAKSALLPGESPEDFERIVQTLDKDFQVEDSIERLIVRQIANVVWKLQRLEHIQELLQANHLARPIRASEVFAMGFPESVGVRYLLDLPEPVAEDGAKYIEQMAGPASLSDAVDTQKKLLIKIKNDRPDIFRHLEQMTTGSGEDVPYPKRIIVQLVGRKGEEDDEGQSQEMDPDTVNDLYRSLIEIRNGCVQIRQRSAEISQLQAKVRMQRLQDLADQSTSRPQDDLLRSLQRLLSELRKQKDWRKVNRIVDMNAEY